MMFGASLMTSSARGAARTAATIATSFAGIAQRQRSRATRAVVGEDRLFAVLVLEIAEVAVRHGVVDRGRRPARVGVMVHDAEDRLLAHVRTLFGAPKGCQVKGARGESAARHHDATNREDLLQPGAE